MAQNYTPFSDVYNNFLSKITDDMYMELTLQDTEKILYELLVAAVPKFQFPRQDLSYQQIQVEGQYEEQTIWAFVNKLTQQEINIISTYMIVEWIGQQLASVENTRMKYSGSDFKFTSQANHMQKLLQMSLPLPYLLRRQTILKINIGILMFFFWMTFTFYKIKQVFWKRKRRVEQFWKLVSAGNTLICHARKEISVAYNGFSAFAELFYAAFSKNMLAAVCCKEISVCFFGLIIN